KHQINGVSFSENCDPLRRLPIPGQRMQEALSGAQQAFAVPTADVDRHAGFGRRSGHQGATIVKTIGTVFVTSRRIMRFVVEAERITSGMTPISCAAKIRASVASAAL